MERVGEHPVPVGPLAVRWLAYELDEARAGAPAKARIRLENAGSAPWRSRGREGVQLSYHWLDTLGNAIVWDGPRTSLSQVVEPGGTVELEPVVVAPRPPGSYHLAFDLVEELRFWFQEVGSAPLDLPIEVKPRIAERRLGVELHGGHSPETDAALAAQEEQLVDERAVAIAHLVAGAVPAPDWSRLLLDAHEEGYAAVGGSIEVMSGRLRRTPAELEPYAPGGGRNPAFRLPLILPSLVPPLEPNIEVAGLPAWQPEGDEPWVYDARIKLRLRSDRRRG